MRRVATARATRSLIPSRARSVDTPDVALRRRKRKQIARRCGQRRRTSMRSNSLKAACLCRSCTKSSTRRGSNPFTRTQNLPSASWHSVTAITNKRGADVATSQASTTWIRSQETKRIFTIRGLCFCTRGCSTRTARRKSVRACRPKFTRLWRRNYHAACAARVWSSCVVADPNPRRCRSAPPPRSFPKSNGR